MSTYPMYAAIGFVQAGIFIDAIYKGKQIRIGEWTTLRDWTSAQWRVALEQVLKGEYA